MKWPPREQYSSLSIDRLLRESKEKEILQKRQITMKRSGFTGWGIWKLLCIRWK